MTSQSDMKYADKLLFAISPINKVGFVWNISNRYILVRILFLGKIKIHNGYFLLVPDPFQKMLTSQKLLILLIFGKYF